MKALPHRACALLLVTAFQAASANPVSLSVKTQLQPPAGETANNFGQSVACGESFIVVGAPGASLVGGVNQGAVYVYDASSFKLLRRIRSPKPVSHEKFGTTLALDGSTLYIGAPGHNGGASNGGAVHAFDLATGSRKWTFASTTAGESLGGHSLAVAADIVAVGQPFSTLGGGSSEAGYVRMLHRKLGIEMGVVTSPGSKPGDRCGFSLSGSGPFLAIGVPSSDLPGTDKGLALIVDARSSYFSSETFYPSSASNFGCALALNGPRLWASTPSSIHRFRPIDGTDSSFLSTPQGASSEFGKVLATMASHVAVSDPTRPGGAKIHGYDLDSGSPTWELSDPNAAQPSSRLGRSLALSSRHIVAGDGQGLLRVVVAELPALPWHPSRVRQILTSSNPAPGENTTFAAITSIDAAVNLQGEVLSLARLAGGSASSSTNSSLWSTMTGFNLVARTGDPLGSQKLVRFSSPVFNGTDRALFLAQASGSTARILLEDQGASAVELLREGASILGGRVLGRIHQFVQPLQMNIPSGSDRFAMAASFRAGSQGVTSANDSAILSSSSVGTVSELAREGSPSPSMALPYGQITPRLSRAGNEVIFTSALRHPDSAYAAGLFRHKLGVGTEGVAGKGETPNQVPDARFRSFLGESCNGAGRFVFRASMSGVSTTEDEGIWANLNNINTTQLLVREGWPAHGLPAGIYVSRFLRVFMVGNDVIVWASLRGLSVNASNNQAVWRYTFNGPSLLLRTGDPAPGCDGARFARILSVDAGAGSSYTLQAVLSGCPSSSNLALFENTFHGSARTFQRQPQLAARKGLIIDRSGPRRITSLVLGRGSADATGFGNKGLGSQVCGLGPLFGARFADGSSQLLLGRQ
jgi:hypothetical protein